MAQASVNLMQLAPKSVTVWNNA